MRAGPSQDILESALLDKRAPERGRHDETLPQRNAGSVGSILLTAVLEGRVRKLHGFVAESPGVDDLVHETDLRRLASVLRLARENDR